MKKHIIAFNLIAVFCMFNAQAQQDSIDKAPPVLKANIGIIGKYTNNRLVVRWAPDNYTAWGLLNKYGYKLEKAQIGKDTQYFKANYKTIGFFKPADSAQWKKRADTSHPYTVIAAGTVLGKYTNALSANPNLMQIQKRYTEELNRYGFAMLAADFDTAAANLLGLRFEDKDVVPGAVYAYRITSMVPVAMLKIEGAENFVDTRKGIADPDPPAITADGREYAITLEWTNKLHRQYYTGYYLEKGDANGKNFKRYNKVPYVLLTNEHANKEAELMTLKDSIKKNYEKYTYRLIGINAFGELSKPGPVTIAWGRDRTPPAMATKFNVMDINKTQMSLTWTKSPMEADFTGYYIESADQYQGPWTRLNKTILSPSATSYIDAKPNVLHGSYYRVVCRDTAGNESFSFAAYGFVKDSFAPAQPTGLKGTVDSNGVVRLHWNLGPEADIAGYRVFYANQNNHEFTNITPYPVADTVFTDTVNINTLTENIFYEVCAVDRNFNHSKRSQRVKILLPDTVPPVKPIFSNILVTDTAVYLSWIPSSSKDVLKHEIYRKTGQGQWTLWKVVSDIRQTSYADLSVKIGEIYVYRIVALDESFNRSGFPAEVSAKIYDTGKRPAIKKFTAAYDKTKKVNVLTWDYPPSDKYHYVVYRSYNGSTFRVYHSVAGKLNRYEDYDLLGIGTYQYAVVAYYNDGGSSGLTETITVEIK